MNNTLKIFFYVNRAQNFKYLSEIVTSNFTLSTANKKKVRGMEIAFKLYQKIYKSRSLCHLTKVSHCNIVVKLGCLIVADIIATKRFLEIKRK